MRWGDTDPRLSAGKTSYGREIGNVSRSDLYALFAARLARQRSTTGDILRCMIPGYLSKCAKNVTATCMGSNEGDDDGYD